MLAFLKHRTSLEALYAGTVVALTDERRLSGKRLMLLEEQRREIERLTAMNAHLAKMVIAQRAEQGLPLDDALLAMIVRT